MSYAESVERFRREKDLFFKSDHDSPIPEDQKSRFVGLRYFPPDASYGHDVKLRRHERPQVVVLATSKGTQQRFYRYGYFDFEVGGKKVRLEAYKSAERDDESLFVPFRDKTSGGESYGAARYLDLHLQPDDYSLDFNFAYNPYCAYSDDYVCPLPPLENWLDVEIRAGEMKYHD